MANSLKERNLRKDFWRLLKILEVMKYFSLGPLASKFKKLPTTILVLFLITSYFNFQLRLDHLFLFTFIIRQIQIVKTLNEIIYCMYCLVRFPYFSQKLKKDLCDNINKLECGGFKNVYNKNHYLLTRLILAYILFLILYTVFFSICFLNDLPTVVVAHSTEVTAVIFTNLIFTYYLFLTDWLRYKYDSFNYIIKKKRFRSKNRLFKIIKGLNLAYKVIENTNELFGFSVFLNHYLFAFEILMFSCYAMDATPHPQFFIQLQYVYPIPFIVSMVIQIMACNAVEKSGIEVINTCYLMHERIEDEADKKHLLLLAKYAKQWRPSFSAAGFYDINQSTLSAMFSAIINYLVIIIQFNMVLTT